GLLQGERRVLRRPRLARWRLQARHDRAGPPVHRGAPAAGRVIGGHSAVSTNNAPLAPLPGHPGAARRVSDLLPVFPWDKLEPYKTTALAHPGGLCDFSVGTPVDSVPEVIQKALAAATDTPGYPTVWGPL